MHRLVLSAVLALVASGCASSLQTGSFVDRDVNFSRYKTYNWGGPGRIEGDPRLERNAFFRDHLQGEVEKQLASKGFAGPQKRRPDLLIRYRAAVSPRMAVANNAAPPVYDGYGYCSVDCNNRVVEYETATLIVDVIDARSKKLVWRGWARNDLHEVIDDEDRMGERLREAVTEMMTKLPGHS